MIINDVTFRTEGKTWDNFQPRENQIDPNFENYLRSVN